MARCGYKTTVVPGHEWECPFEALPGEEFCYWHKEEDGKEPDQEMLKELREKEIFGAYLKKANLQGAFLRYANLQHVNFQEASLIAGDLQDANLENANLEHTNLQVAKLQKANLRDANLQGAFLQNVNLQEANLVGANLQKANLLRANLQSANLTLANLQNANLQEANLRRAYLRLADLREADLGHAGIYKAILFETILHGVNLHGVWVNSETVFDGSLLIDANLYHSYFDEAKSFRNVILFHPETDREINEIIGDALGKKTKVSKKNARLSLRLKPIVLNLAKIKEKDPNVAAKIMEEGLVRYAGTGDKIMFFDRSSQCAIKNPEKGWRRKASLVEIEELSDLIIKDGEIQPEFIHKGSRADLFEASYEVYNNLYNFYIANGSRDQAGRVHYRRGEAYRKLLREKGGLSWLRSWFFDFLVLQLMAGYGDRIKRPFGAAVTVIAVFAFLFWWFDGIVKNVNGEPVTPGWFDYVYHSITTFTSLGYSNIQPNLNVSTCFNLANFKFCISFLPQILVAFESVIGILLMALIIFVVTYHVSR